MTSVVSSAVPRPPGEWGWFDDTLSTLVESATGFEVAIGVLVAVAVGVAHALGPGHGKALIAAYLAGTDGRRRDALALGGLVAAMHAVSVLVLGAVFVALGSLPAGEAIGGWLRVAAGCAVTGVGVAMLVRLHRHRRARVHPDPAPVAIAAGPGGGHDPSAHHDAMPAGVAPLSRPGIVAMAAAGGLLPSPAAFLVLVGGVALGRAWFGLALVLAFSAGMATALAAIGLAVVAGRDRATSSSPGRPWVRRALTLLPVVSAGAIVAGGLLVAGAGLLSV